MSTFFIISGYRTQGGGARGSLGAGGGGVRS